MLTVDYEAPIMYYIILHYIILYYIILYYIISYHIISYCIISYIMSYYHIMLYCISLQGHRLRRPLLPALAEAERVPPRGPASLLRQDLPEHRRIPGLRMSYCIMSYYTIA